MHAQSGRQLDLSSPAPPPQSAVRDRQSEGRKFLGIHFTCCDAYSRVYANVQGTAYVGHCPRCAKRIQFRVGHGGTDQRFFSAG